MRVPLVFSIVAHAVAVGTMIIVPALATEELPEPRRTSEFIIVKPEMPAPPVVRQQRAEVASSTAIPVPLSPPEGIQPAPIVEPPIRARSILARRRRVFPLVTSFPAASPPASTTADSVSPQDPCTWAAASRRRRSSCTSIRSTPNPPRGAQRRAGDSRGADCRGRYSCAT